MNNLEKEANLLARLLKENREVVSNALSKYEDDEGPPRMQKMLREYFKKQRQDLQQQIEEEALLILEIFPDVDLLVLQGLLYDAGDDVMRTKTVIQQLSSKNGFKRNTNSKGNDDSPSKKQKMNKSTVAADISVAGSSTSCQPAEDYLIEKHNFDITQEKVIMEAKYNEMLQTLMDILPDADPDYLQKSFQSFSEAADFNLFVTEALESRNYPKAKTTAKIQSILPNNQDPTELYTTKFSATAFLEIIPDPNTHFKKNRVLKPWTAECNAYAFTALLNIYCGIQQSAVKTCFANARGFLDACDMLDKISNTFPTLRKFCMPTIPQNIALLQEIAYKTHYNKIMEVLKNRVEQYNKKIADATAAGLVLTCNCCFDDAVLLEDTFECCLNCTFCKDCIKSSVEIAFGDGKLKFNCLGNCEGQFSMQVLQAVLPAKLFSKICDKRQAEEVKAAEIENLEFCPFCDFAAIPAQGNSIFNCLNPECARESCRLCKEPSHIPFRCNEVERDENVKARTYVENKMSEALLKKCKKCEKLYFKDDGCNMMMCSCGAQMCDACGKLINNLSHFSQYREGKFGRCPLWSDTLKTNEEKLREVAESAKKEVNKSGQLKIDPTADIPNHFAELLTRRETSSDWNKPDNFLKSRINHKKKTK